jgi:2-polyprenyl-6-methoxyphenol hydroxylase-like FAD-dependent oxidoreductase
MAVGIFGEGDAMRVVIAGAGIGGLATALSLHAAGVTDIVVCEAVDQLRPLGLGINLLPHAVRELTELGLADGLAADAVACAELAYYNRFGQRIWSEPRGVGAGYRWPQYSIHRGRLQMLLLAAVADRLGPGAVRTGHALTAVEQSADSVTVTFAHGARISADLLVGADGIRSQVRTLAYPDEGPPAWNGLVLWRGVTEAPPFLSGRSMIMAGDGTEKFVAYPIREAGPAGEPALVNWVAERPADGPTTERGDWNGRVDPTTVLRHFADWRFDWLDIRRLIEAAPAVYEYPMVDRDPLPAWTDGRVTLVGDAAHAMYPIGSNGASQAILDARVLAFELAASGLAGLAAYERQRRPPTTALCLANRQMGPEVVMKLAHERAPLGFTRVEDVFAADELQTIAAGYKRTAGFDPALLNERASYDVAS